MAKNTLPFERFTQPILTKLHKWFSFIRQGHQQERGQACESNVCGSAWSKTTKTMKTSRQNNNNDRRKITTNYNKLQQWQQQQEEISETCTCVFAIVSGQLIGAGELPGTAGPRAFVRLLSGVRPELVEHFHFVQKSQSLYIYLLYIPQCEKVLSSSAHVFYGL